MSRVTQRFAELVQSVGLLHKAVQNGSPPLTRVHTPWMQSTPRAHASPGAEVPTGSRQIESTRSMPWSLLNPQIRPRGQSRSRLQVLAQ